MAVTETTLQEWREEVRADTTEERAMEHAPLSRVIEVVNEIMGYDLIKSQLMTEGYLRNRDADRNLAEGDMAAGYEILPPE